MVISSKWPAHQQVAQLSTLELVVRDGTTQPLTQRVPERIGTVVVPGAERRGSPPVIEVRLLGQFVVALGGRSAGPWGRPTARRLCQLVLVSPGGASPGRRPARPCSRRYHPTPRPTLLYKALSLARSALGQLGPAAEGLLCADRRQVWVAPDVAVEVDLDAHEKALRAASRERPGPATGLHASQRPPGRRRPVGGRAGSRVGRPGTRAPRVPAPGGAPRTGPRPLARRGRARPDEVLAAWQVCFAADPADEEAASALIRLHVAQGRAGSL